MPAMQQFRPEWPEEWSYRLGWKRRGSLCFVTLADMKTRMAIGFVGCAAPHFLSVP